MSCRLYGVFICSVIVLLFLQSTTVIAVEQNEVGGTFTTGGELTSNNHIPLNDLDTELNFGIGYKLLNGDVIKETYTGMPQIGVGITFLVSPHIRTFIRLDYASVSADPLVNVPGFEYPQETTIKSIPMTFGLRFNLSQNQKLRLQMGLGVQVAWQQEETIDTLYNGTNAIRVSSGYNYGFMGTFGPEFVLGSSENILGIEFGIGGVKGEINDGDYRHNIDLTGFNTRVYYAIGL